MDGGEAQGPSPTGLEAPSPPSPSLEVQSPSLETLMELQVAVSLGCRP